jgi:dTDP-4-amino-4,6-dideoxygalactose transaminase
MDGSSRRWMRLPSRHPCFAPSVHFVPGRPSANLSEQEASVSDSTLALLGGKPAVTIRREFPWPILTDEDIAAVGAAMRAGLTSDPGYCEPVREFEARWAEMFDMPFALSRVNGSAALHSALFAAGVGPGDEVIVPSYAWIATAGCVLAAGAVPVFADIDGRTFTLDPADVARRVTTRTRAIVALHLWGHAADMDALAAIAERHRFCLIEDASHAHGGTYRGRRLGTIGDIGCFSLQASKAMPAGEGGMLLTRRREFYERALLLAQSPGRLALHLELPGHRQYRETGFGAFKYRINPLNAVIGLRQMAYLEERNRIRTANMNYLTDALQGVPGIETPYTAAQVDRGGFYGYRLLYKPQELRGLPLSAFLEALRAEGVPAEPERYPMLHTTPMYTDRNPPGCGWPWSHAPETQVRYGPGTLPVTEEIYPRLIAIPSYNRATPCKDLHDQYAEAFRKVSRGAAALAAVSAGAA